MKARILTMSLAVVALALTGCNKDENGVNEFQNGELRLTSGVNTLTRSFGIDEQIKEGQEVAVYVDKATEPVSQLYGNNVLTAGSNGALTGGTAMYFPGDKSNIDIYAFVTNATLADVFPTSALTHSVKTDQTGIADYATSDLLYAANKGVAFTKSDVDLKFYHMLSKVEVVLTPGSGLRTSDLTGAKVKILGTKLKADFTPDKTKTIATESERTVMITPTADDNAPAPIAIQTVVTENFGTITDYAEAVIVPQAVAQSTPFIEVTLSAGATLVYRLDAETTFASGKKYQYKITVNLTGLTVTSSIANWEEGGDKTGNAEME